MENSANLAVQGLAGGKIKAGEQEGWRKRAVFLATSSLFLNADIFEYTQIFQTINI
jgi:hypothetical protein